MSWAMTIPEREAFLVTARVAVLSLVRPGRGPLSSPVWYDYQPSGQLWFLTQSTSRKGQLIAPGTRLSLTVQKEDAPYAYVSVEGPVFAVEPYDFEADLLPMATRYLGAPDGRAYVDRARRLADEHPAVATRIKVVVHPEEWLTVDYAKRG